MLLQADAFEAIAVVIVASQKSAPVAVTVISYITGDVSAQGLLAIPAIVGQLTQIFMGSAISTLVAKYVSEPGWLHAPLFCLNQRELLSLWPELPPACSVPSSAVAPRRGAGPQVVECL